MPERIRVVVVGHGMVGARFVEELSDRDHEGRFDITVLGAEDHDPYNRVLLSDLLAGRVGHSSLALPAPRRPDRPPVRVHRGRAAVRIDRDRRVVEADDGHRHAYDVLVLATGARARIPAITGLQPDGRAGMPRGVHVLRSLQDARAILAESSTASRAAVVGGGVLGVEAAVGLAAREVPTTLVHPLPALMERQLDVAASEVLASRLEAVGVASQRSAATTEVLTSAGRVVGLRLGDDSLVSADLVVLSCGTVAESGLAAAAGLPVGRGITIGADLASPADCRVFALGDCAEPPEGASGLVAQGWDQARRLAVHLVATPPLQPVTRPATATAQASAGPPDAAASSTAPADHSAALTASGLLPRGPQRSPVLAAAPSTDVVRVKGVGVDVVAMGQGASASPQPGDRVLRLSDPGEGRFVEVVVRDGRVVGATCVGAGQVGADLTVAYTRGTPVPADPALLLIRPVGAAPATTASPTNMPGSMTVCRCNGVTKGAIVACFGRGARTMADVAAGTRATTGCGGCSEVVEGLLDWLRTTDPDTPAASHPSPAEGEQVVPPMKQPEHGAETPAA